jgi:hypothetical protein
LKHAHVQRGEALRYQLAGERFVHLDLGIPLGDAPIIAPPAVT